MEDQTPLVSIGLPTWKCEKRIRGILDALLGQDYQNIEVIVSDDASPDEGYKIIEEYAARDKRVTFFHQQKNIGYLRNFELVLKKAKGKYFFWAADDDLWEKTFLSALKSVLDAHPQYGLAMPSMKLVYDDGEVKERVVLTGAYDLTHKGSVAIFNAALYKHPPVHFFYYGLWKTDALKNLVFWKGRREAEGFYSTIAHDKTLLWEAALSFPIYTIPDVLWHKTIYRETYYERYSPDSKKMFLSKKGYLRFVALSIKRLTLSPNVPFYKKLLMPYLAGAIIWSEKKNLLKEVFPQTYYALYKMLGNK